MGRVAYTEENLFARRELKSPGAKWPRKVCKNILGDNIARCSLEFKEIFRVKENKGKFEIFLMLKSALVKTLKSSSAISINVKDN